MERGRWPVGNNAVLIPNSEMTPGLAPVLRSLCSMTLHESCT